MDKEDLKAIAELLDTKLEPIKEEIKYMKIQQKQDHEILKALEHSSEISKSERDKISNDIAHIQGDVKNINENLDAVKEILGRHEVDITVLKRRPV
jgi:predicted  nucleic acid-binding Zn-ribbon protein